MGAPGRRTDVLKGNTGYHLWRTDRLPPDSSLNHRDPERDTIFSLFILFIEISLLLFYVKSL